MTTTIAKIRDDLLYYPDPDDDTRELVKDPIRRQFFRYNVLQVAMMKALDGRRTLEEVSAALEAQFDAEVPVASIQRFVSRLEKNFLLDVASYTVSDAKTRKQVLLYLQKKRFGLRMKARDSDAPEGRLFEQGLLELTEGDPAKAARCFQEVLEINPKNERARQILGATHEAFFKTHTEAPSHARLVHLFNPDSLMAWVDRKLGWFLFSAPGAVLMTLFVLSSIVPSALVMSDPAVHTDIGVTGLISAIICTYGMILFHEFCHGFACRHYGGRVDDLGVMFLYGALIPFGYCDTSDAYIIKGTRAKIVVQAAGPMGSLVQHALVAHLLALTEPTFPFWQGLALANGVILYINFQSMAPFLKDDSYYALCEWLGIVNLDERAGAYAKAVLARALFGVTLETEKLKRKDKLLFFGFATGALVFKISLYYAGFISFLCPWLIDKLGLPGVFLAGFLFYKRIARPVIRSIVRWLKFILKHRRVVFTPLRALAFAGVIAGIAYGLSLPWPLYVNGEFTVEPIVRAEVRVTEPGLVAKVQVREGDVVTVGQVLVVLTSDALVRERALAFADAQIAQSRLELLEKGARPEDIRLAAAQARAGSVRSAVAARRLSDARTLTALGVGTTGGLDRERARASAAGGAASVTRADADVRIAAARPEAIAELTADLRRWTSRVEDLDARIASLEIRSKIAGVVVSKLPEQNEGKWLEAGTMLLEIHDTSAWRARIVPDSGEPLDGVKDGLKVMLAARSDAVDPTPTTIAEVLPPPDRTMGMLIYTAPVRHASWRSGMSGKARIFARKRSVLFRLVVLPVTRIIDFGLPQLKV